MVFAQTPVPAKGTAVPEAARSYLVDVHPSPYRVGIYYRTNISDQRFAYKREDSAILGGPTWIDFYRFDVAAKIPSLKLPNPSVGLRTRKVSRIPLTTFTRCSSVR